MASFTGSSIKDVYKDILHTSNSNTGLSTTIKQITCGDGDGTSLYLSQRNLKVQPSADTTTNTVIYDADGNALVTVDSTNDLVKAGIGQHIVNTQFKTFSLFDFSPAAGTHHPLTTNIGASEGTAYTGDANGSNWGGTGTDPATSLSVSSAAEQFVPSVWILQGDITINEINYVMSADGSTTANLHVNSYSIVSGSGSTAGNLSSGAVIADSSAITIGDDRASNGTLTISTDRIDSGKAIVVFAENIGGTDDITVQVNIKYHLR
jgi:hypothetical protein